MSLTVAGVQADFAQPAAWTLIESNAYVDAALAALLPLALKDEKNYGPVTALLNAASYAFVTATRPDAPDTELVIFFDTPHHHISRGDYLGRNAKADWVAFLVPLSDLRAVVETQGAVATSATAAIPQGWPRFIGIGEGKPKVSRNSGQFLKYLGALKMYRPDLTTVHGFQLSRGQLRISSLNPCGVFRSEYFPRATKSAWVAYIVLLYKAHMDRDTHISHRAPEDEHVRCDVTLPRGTFCFTPFHASGHPGRMTWVAFQIGEPSDELSAICQRDCVGAVKVSWQDQSSAYTEKQLFDKAHEKTWLPGLARHWSCERDAGSSIHVGTSVTRVKETLHLASVGDPLSQCRSALHALKVVYDLTEVHLQLLRRGVLHRDVSWYNVLCNPWHDPATLELKPVASGVPCIEWILTNTASEPCVLLTDLDHSALYPNLYDADHPTRRERTGTPMFMAMELSAYKKAIPYAHTAPNQAALCKRLTAVEGLGEVYTRAFPDDDGAFMRNFRKVCMLEDERRLLDETVTTKMDELHRPAHDVESIMWTALWLFVRAHPEGTEAFDVSDATFNQFVNEMLEHRINGTESNTRPAWVKGGTASLNLLHARLERFVKLFDTLAAYMSFPWHLYQHIVKDDHAHVAMRRLLLVEIHAVHCGSPDDDVLFTCDQPRIYRVSTTPLTDRVTEPVTRDHLSIAASDVSTGSKRKLPDDDEDGPEKKRAKSDDEELTAPDDRHTCRLWGCNVQSAGARSEKAWDNFLWFGLGQRKASRQQPT